MSRAEPPARSVSEVLDLFEEHGHDRYDEEVTQLEHALQTAALAVSEAAGDALVAAALLHDVGHLLDLRDVAAGRSVRSGATPADPLDPDSDLRHEARGARWLASIFPPAVTSPVALHVAAKRYLCAVDEDHIASLSHGSVASLARQGGPMDADEVVRFRALPAHFDALRLRRWDDSGKQTEGVEVPPLSTYRSLLERSARR